MKRGGYSHVRSGLHTRVGMALCTDQTRNVMALCLGSASPRYLGDHDMHALISVFEHAEMIVTLFV